MKTPKHESVIVRVYELSRILCLPVLPVQDVEINTEEF
jgi:hypothetical protein